jgi:integrase
MSVRKRQWTTGRGVAKEAWVVDYVDGAAQRRLRTFPSKKEADAFAAKAGVEVREGTQRLFGAEQGLETRSGCS